METTKIFLVNSYLSGFEDFKQDFEQEFEQDFKQDFEQDFEQAIFQPQALHTTNFHLL